ncbi:DoxX family protein [Nocardia paucivorans]|uniref:DoxX family protein n=1 Tax=Nocardia paucivorans TaxID=114259 RepID=UPI0003029A1D|nr:DoxX family protein [Nocardia paucivorans]
MSIAYTVVTVLAAAWVGFSAGAVFAHAGWVVDALRDYGIPESWWPWLGTAKALGAVGLIVGLFVPIVGAPATIGLVLYFAGAVLTVLRARAYSHIPYPLLYLTPVVVASGLGLAA